MRAHFMAIADHIESLLQTGESSTAWFAGEDSDFVRLTKGRVRQPGSVSQQVLTLRLMCGKRHNTAELSLAGQLDEDRARVARAVDRLRQGLSLLPEDPYLLVDPTPHRLLDDAPPELPETIELVETLLTAAAGRDLVGILAAGAISRGFASSHGARCWSARASWSADYCVVYEGDKAVKDTVAGTALDAAALARRVEAAAARAQVLARPPRAIEPGEYRAWLSPAALNEVIGLLSWSAFGGQAVHTGTSPLSRFAPGGDRLSSMVQLDEHVAGGLAPGFSPDGYLRPASVPLIEDGVLGGKLVSPRAGAELGLDHNGASADEQPDSLRMAPGALAESEVAAAIGTGLWISNLWYLNFSDRSACRMTGMTRFATFWVENGEIVAPVPVMRFDDTLGRMLGSQLEALGDRAELVPSVSTYFSRSTSSVRLPGALLGGLRLTL